MIITEERKAEMIAAGLLCKHCGSSIFQHWEHWCSHCATKRRPQLTKRQLIDKLEALPVPDDGLVCACVMDGDYVSDVSTVGDGEVILS